MQSLGIRALLARALAVKNDQSPTKNGKVDSDRVAALDELTRLAKSYLDDLAARYDGQVWGECSVNDLCQISLTKAIQSLDDFRGHSSQEFCAWLARILETTRIDLIRRTDARRPRNGVVVPLDVQDDSEAGGGGTNLQATDLSVSKKVQLKLAIERLSAGDQTLVALRYEQCLTISDIAKHLQRDERTVRRDLERIHLLLRDEVEPIP